MNLKSSNVAPETQINHVRQAILREFGAIIDLSNVETKKPQEVEQRRMSRSLAALAVRRLTDCESAIAAASVIDGRDDQGIDAIAFGDSAPELFLVQAKWSDRGNAGIDTSAARAMVDGFRKIEARDFERFNERFDSIAEQVKGVLHEPNLRVTFVLAVMGDGHMSPEVQGIFDDACREYNGFGPWLHYRVLNAAEFWGQVREDLSGADSNFSVRMNQWIHRNQPTDAYQGSVPADEVAAWYEKYGDRLFDRNVRRSLGLTSVNQSMVETLKNHPTSFWSRNNGITILCSEIEPHFWGSRRAANEPVELKLRGASVVNGAQTVSATQVANEASPETVCDADISVRVICVPADGTDDFGSVITRSTNTQNHMERRDFIAIDPTQIRIREDFALTLDKTYVFKRGDMDPAPDAGCSVVHAAVALACAHRNSDLVVRAKRDTNLLFEEGSGGAYPLLFGNQPSAQQIWRSVLQFRAVIGAVHEESRRLDGRAATIGEHGELMIAHIVFRLIGFEKLEEPECDWAAELENVPNLVSKVLFWLIDQVDRQFGSASFITSTFANPDRCRTLAANVLERVTAGESAPEVSLEYRPPAKESRGRSQNAVHVLLDAGRIEPGAMLHYVPSNERERIALDSWLSGDDRRARATWVAERGRPLLWAVDGKQYSPTGLVKHMWQEAGWDDSPVAVQGPKCWHLGGNGSLVELAVKLRRAEEE